MKIIRFIFAMIVIGLTSFSSAFAHDSFSFGLNIGGYGPSPVVRYYSAPPVVYYGAPTVFYGPAPRTYYYAQRPSYGYRHYENGPRIYGRDWDNDDNRGHRGGWGHGGDGYRGRR